MSNHTPGPWKWTYRQTPKGNGEVVTHAVMLVARPWNDGTGECVTTLFAVRDDWAGWMQHDCSAGDRALIAAAPELFTVLRELTNWCRERTSPVHHPELTAVLIDAVNVLKKVDPNYPLNGE